MKERGLLTQLVATIGGILHLIMAVGPFVVADHSEKPAPPPVVKAPAHPKPAPAYPKPAPAPMLAPAEEVMKLALNESIVGTYTANAAAGDQKYLGRTIEMQATLGTVRKTGNRYYLDSDIDHCLYDFASGEASKVAHLYGKECGHQIVIRGKCDGKVGTSDYFALVRFSDCVIVADSVPPRK
jgi:hypothetical protein